MARVYDIVCCNCGEIMEWCKYDAPIENCENCLIVYLIEESGLLKPRYLEWEVVP